MHFLFWIMHHASSDHFHGFNFGISVKLKTKHFYFIQKQSEVLVCWLISTSEVILHKCMGNSYHFFIHLSFWTIYLTIRIDFICFEKIRCIWVFGPMGVGLSFSLLKNDFTRGFISKLLEMASSSKSNKH